MSQDRDEPAKLSWPGGDASAGYLGGRRWRCLHGGETIDVDDTRAAAAALVRAMLEAGHGGATGDEAELTGVGETVHLARSLKATEGWTARTYAVYGHVGSPTALEEYIATRLAEHATSLWASGVEPKRPTPLSFEYAFDEFARDADAAPRCQRLAEALNLRLTENPSSKAVLDAAIEELKRLGHDLWVWEPGHKYGYDYMRPRKGSGMVVLVTDLDEGSGETVPMHFQVTFERR